MLWAECRMLVVSDWLWVWASRTLAVSRSWAHTGAWTWATAGNICLWGSQGNKWQLWAGEQHGKRVVSEATFVAVKKKKKNLFWFWIVWTVTQNRQGNRVLCKTNSRSDFNWMIASGLWPESPTTTSYVSRDKQGYKWIVLAVLCLCLYIEKRKTLFGQNKDTYVFIYSAIYVTCLFCITQDG